MNVSVETLGPCKKLLRVEVPVEKVNAAFDELTGTFQKQAQLPGFRPGKAPKHLIVKSYEGRIHEEARKKLFEDSYRQAAADQKLRVIVTIDVEEQSFGRGVPFGYTVTLEHAPEFDLPNYQGLAAQRETTLASDADVDRAVNILREQQVKYDDVTRAAQTGDAVVVHYKGTCEGKPLTDFNPAAKGLTEKQNTWLLIAENSFIPRLHRAARRRQRRRQEDGHRRLPERVRHQRGRRQAGCLRGRGHRREAEGPARGG